MRYVRQVPGPMPLRNPFTPEGTYGADWVRVRVVEQADFEMMTGMDQCFGLTLSAASRGWAFRMMDFIGYHERQGRHVWIDCPPALLSQAEREYGGHDRQEPTRRPYEPRVLCHSTTPGGWAGIQRDGELKSWNQLKRAGAIAQQRPIGALLGDPEDFSDYVMLGSGVAGEIVAASHQAGRLVMDIHGLYQPGARIYFETERLIGEGLWIRDGAHFKTRAPLPLALAGYIALPEALGLPTPCTLASFAGAADEAARQALGDFGL